MGHGTVILKMIYSYKTILAQALLGKEPGATVTTKIGDSEEQWTVISIDRWVDLKVGLLFLNLDFQIGLSVEGAPIS